MATLRTPIGVPPAGVAFPDAGSSQYFNQTYQTPFANVYMYTIGAGGNQTAQILLSGIQSFRPVENATTQDGYMSGSDWIEFIMQPRVWSVQCTRMIPRGYDLRSIMRQIYGATSDIDFRGLPVVIEMDYDQRDPSGQNLVEQASWGWAIGTFQTVDGPYWDSPYSAFMETWTWKGRGIGYSDLSGNSYSNSTAYWGAAPTT